MIARPLTVLALKASGVSARDASPLGASPFGHLVARYTETLRRGKPTGATRTMSDRHMLTRCEKGSVLGPLHVGTVLRRDHDPGARNDMGWHGRPHAVREY